MAVACRVLELLVSEQHLNEANILATLQEMGGERMAQRMQREALVDLSGGTRQVKGPAQLSDR